MEFIREHIKEKPISKRRIIRQFAVAAASGVIFAVAAGAVLLLSVPLFRSALAQGTEKTTESSQPSELPDSEQETQTDQLPLLPPDDVIISVEKYQELQNQLYAIGNEGNKAIVTVTTVVSEMDWLKNVYEIEGQGSGVIVSDDANYYYVLTEKKVIQDTERIRVSFIDGTGADATLLGYDGNTGVAILAVEKRLVDSATTKKIAVAKFGNSYSVENGTIVIALGSPLGTNYSILTGNITSNTNEIATLDKNYDVFTTDIVAGENGSGILINTQGELIGMVMQAFRGSQPANTLTAVSVSEIRGIVDRLVAGKSVPYIGLYVSTVTKDISTAHNIPMGVFIKEVKTDSPAMYAGLQSGDIITKINGEDIYSDATYSSKIQMLLPGTSCEITVRRQNGENYMEIKCEVELGILQ